MNALIERYEEIRNQVDEAARRAGREAGSVTLLPVSKTFPVEEIRILYGHGIRIFGENRIPELASKAAVLPGDIEWHLIGQLQANKVRKAVQLASAIHSVDSAALLERIDRIAGEEGRKPKIYLEVNSGEESKSGCAFGELGALAMHAAELSHVELAGLMTMAPAGASSEELLEIFGRLAGSLAELRRGGLACTGLSMGMSGDFREAIASGATLVRIGTSIFGGRKRG